MRARILGNLDADLLPDDTTLESTATAALDSDGRLSVRKLVSENHQPKGSSALLLLTSHDLSMPGCDSLFGYASRQHRVAIVSTHRLGGVSKEQLRKRVANVIAHEQGHLDGLCHCKTKGCLMNPARSVEDIDTRSSEPCGRCPRTGVRVMGPLVAVSVFLLLILAIDTCAGALKVSKQPFSWQEQGESISLRFKKTPLFVLGKDGASSTPMRAEALTRTLNQLFLQIHPPSIKVQRQGTDKAIITAGGSPIVEVLPGDVSGGSALQTAQEWVEQIEPLIRGKGFKTESCVGCHVNGIDRIDYEIQSKGKLRK